jgi:hypothetical protein
LCQAGSYLIKHAYQHWEKSLTPTPQSESSYSPIVEGTVQVPLFRTSSYDGKLIQVWHEMTVFVTKEDERQSKHSSFILVTTTPIMKVSIVNGSLLK